MARHRGDQKHLARHRFPAAHEKLDQITEGALYYGFDIDQMVGAIWAND